MKTKQIIVGNIDEIVEKLLGGVAALIVKEKSTHQVEQSQSNLQRIAGKTQYLQDRLTAIEEEQKAREELNSGEFLSSKVQLSLEAAALKRRLEGIRAHKQYYTEY